MKSLKVELRHCYGIKKLDYNFDLTKRIASIYAPNGIMKTSFAKTFKDISNGSVSSDLMFPQRETVRNVKDDTDKELDKESVFVIDPYDEGFKSEKMSTLLVNKELRKRFDEIHVKIDKAKEVLLKELKTLSGLKIETIEEELSRAVKLKEGLFYKSLLSIEPDILDKSEPHISDIKYTSIFNDKVISFLATKGVKEKISEYIKKYDELIDSSRFFKKGVFNHTNASDIAKNLTSNGFFKAKHSVTLNASDGKQEIADQKQLEEVIKNEKETILNNPALVTAFEELDKQLTKNADLRTFREYLLINQKILPELGNVGHFRQQLWISYLKSNREQYEALLNEYKLGEKELEEIREQAKKEATDWLNVIGIFNERFTVPFIIEVENQADVILSNDVPVMKFVFKDLGEKAIVDKTNLLKALSNGEKRALYLLNIIFEIEARKKTNQRTLLIIDDIADSFDYKNKYAIIEYLKDIYDNDIFYQIILSHNFDFFRTISTRFKIRKYSYMIRKTDEGIDIIKAQGLNPFKYFKENLHLNEYILIASIPFIRNLIEYTKGTQDILYQQITSLLHIKPDSNSIKKKDIQQMINTSLSLDVTLTDSNKSVINLAYELADQLSKDPTINVNLENKIVLSIAIRLKAEEFMIKKINDPNKIRAIDSNQTLELFGIYSSEISPDPEALKILEQVNLMTPENIHLNSFMYEPIIDMSDDHLKRLYAEVLALSAKP